MVENEAKIPTNIRKHKDNSAPLLDAESKDSAYASRCKACQGEHEHEGPNGSVADSIEEWANGDCFQDLPRERSSVIEDFLFDDCKVYGKSPEMEKNIAATVRFSKNWASHWY
jgi:hypothetical protein